VHSRKPLCCQQYCSGNQPYCAAARSSVYNNKSIIAPPQSSDPRRHAK
jgi:hypothetical protein